MPSSPGSVVYKRQGPNDLARSPGYGALKFRPRRTTRDRRRHARALEYSNRAGAARIRDSLRMEGYPAPMLLSALDRAIGHLDLEGRHLLVAVSGGLDSTALLQGLFQLADLRSLTLSVGHVNHGLRGADSEADESGVRELADRLGLRISSERVDPRALRVGTSKRARTASVSSLPSCQKPSSKTAGKWKIFQ